MKTIEQTKQEILEKFLKRTIIILERCHPECFYQPTTFKVDKERLLKEIIELASQALDRIVEVEREEIIEQAGGIIAHWDKGSEEKEKLPLKSLLEIEKFRKGGEK